MSILLLTATSLVVFFISGALILWWSQSTPTQQLYITELLPRFL